MAGTTLAWVWRASPEDPVADPQAFARVLDSGVRIGFERTLEQDAAFGIHTKLVVLHGSSEVRVEVYAFGSATLKRRVLNGANHIFMIKASQVDG